MRRAIITLAIGKKFINNFDRYCRQSWELYCEKHNLDLIVYPEPLDKSARAAGRSPAWQKCLILSQDDAQKYDQVCWVDSDILINPQSPDIFTDIPVKKIGAVDEYANPSREENRASLKMLYDYWDKKGVKYISNLTPTEYHNNWGLKGAFESVVQTGVLALSPKHHRELLEHVYYDYEDKGDAAWNYEMRPLSFEILSHDLACWIDPKFNRSWMDIKLNTYPFLKNTKNPLFRYIKQQANINIFETQRRLKMKCATTAFLNNYFLHFVRCSDEMRYVNHNITSLFEIHDG